MKRRRPLAVRVVYAAADDPATRERALEIIGRLLDRAPVAPPRPRGTVAAKMCARCPFRPDGSGYAQEHADLPRIVASVERGGAFYCHETALLDPRTRRTASGDPDGIQPHFELCRGAHERHMAAWRAGVLAAGRTPADPDPDPATAPGVTPRRYNGNPRRKR